MSKDVWNQFTCAWKLISGSFTTKHFSTRVYWPQLGATLWGQARISPIFIYRQHLKHEFWTKHQEKKSERENPGWPPSDCYVTVGVGVSSFLCDLCTSEKSPSVDWLEKSPVVDWLTARVDKELIAPLIRDRSMDHSSMSQKLSIYCHLLYEWWMMIDTHCVM